MSNRGEVCLHKRAQEKLSLADHIAKAPLPENRWLLSCDPLRSIFTFIYIYILFFLLKK